MKKQSIKAKIFDKKFDKGEDISKYLDISKANRPELRNEKINISFPSWMMKSVDKEAKKLGVTREFVIKQWISDKIKQLAV